jgi:hypothetical protein
VHNLSVIYICYICLDKRLPHNHEVLTLGDDSLIGLTVAPIWVAEEVVLELLTERIKAMSSIFRQYNSILSVAKTEINNFYFLGTNWGTQSARWHDPKEVIAKILFPEALRQY